MYSGYTDSQGYVDATFTWDDCDIVGCDDPDIYLRFECSTPWVDVEDAGVFEDNYSWDNEDEAENDFQGTGIDFGTMSPDDPTEDPAVHIHNSITRAYRFILDNVGTDVAHVDVQWPDGDFGAWYDGEIHVSSAEEWTEGAHIKEYGRHYLANYSQNPEPGFCNCICDADCNNDECGHCTWCTEDDVAAWVEGWTNWVGSVVNRSYLGYYGFDPLSIDDARFTLESLEPCPEDGALHNPLTTEGFIGALCRDIEDDAQDDHDGDGVEDCERDSLALGADEIFDVVRIDEPTTPSDFILAFRNRFPQYKGGLWRTAINVGGAVYVWPDTEPPGVVTAAWSPTHPDSFFEAPGGTSPFITVEFEHAPDDASGAVAYSIEWSDQPAVVPDFTAELENPDATTSSVTSPPFDLGEYYLSLRAQDCAGNWSDEWSNFGPFIVTECNGNGIVDICETDCDAIPGFCEGITGCGTVVDCNGNHIPDECDVADGSSSDCDVNGVPDECEAFDTKSWVADSGGAWYGDEQNWEGGVFPGPGDLVCINVPDQVVLVAHSQGVTDISGLGCYEDFTLDGSSTLRPSGNAAFFEALSWTSGTHSAPDGTPPEMAHTLTYGPVSLAGEFTRTLARRTLDNMGQATFSNGGSLYLDSGSLLNNMPGATFDINADGDIYWTSSTTISTIDNQGTFTKSGGTETGESFIYPIFVNSGLLDVQSSQMTFRYGGLNVVQPGVVQVGPDATLYLDSMLANSNHHFGDGTTVTGDGHVTFDENAQIEGEYEIAGTTRIVHGVIGFTSADGAASIENYVQIGGTLTGTDDVTAVNLLEWTGGTMTVPNGTPPDIVHTFATGGMALGGSSFRTLSGRTLNNLGDATLNDNGSLYMDSAAV